MFPVHWQRVTLTDIPTVVKLLEFGWLRWPLLWPEMLLQSWQYLLDTENCIVADLIKQGCFYWLPDVATFANSRGVKVQDGSGGKVIHIKYNI